jgi:hypothetical protein
VEVTFIPHHKIDKTLWDNCINNAQHSSLYSTSFYLDTMPGKWDALVVNNYEIVMPLIHKKKYCISYLYQPAYLPQVGIFSSKGINENTIKLFIDKCFSLFKFIEISLLFPNYMETTYKNLTYKPLNNFVLKLEGNYESIRNNYLPSFHKSLRRLQKLSLNYCKSNDVKKTISTFKEIYLERIKSLKEKDLIQFEKVCKGLKQDCIIRQVKDKNENIIASVILLKFKNRLYNMQSYVTPEGKRMEANYFLYDKIIEEFSDKNYVLDFEGSSIKGIAAFYEKMNPVNEPSLFIKYNNLPKIIKLIKK